MAHTILQTLRRRLTEEDGSVTTWNMAWAAGFLLFAGLAIDTSNAHRNQAKLQAAADASALAAVMAHRSAEHYGAYFGGDGSGVTPEVRASRMAQAIAATNMPNTDFGEVLDDADIEYGNWTSAGGFVAGSGDFIRVTTRRASQNDNPVGTFFLGLFGGLRQWELGAVAIAHKFSPACSTNGIITEDVVDFQSRNTWTSGICIHGEGGVELNQNNTFEPGVIVSMPDQSLLTTPGGRMGNNAGLAEALHYGSLSPHLAHQVDDIIYGLLDPGSKWQPDYINAAQAEVHDLNVSNFDPEALEAGHIYDVFCQGRNGKNGTLNLRGKQTGDTLLLSQVVIVTNCRVVFDSDTVVSDAMIATSNADDKSVQGSAGVMIGAPDNCQPGGGAQIITAGGLHFAAKMEFHGAELISKGPVKMAAQVDGMAGTSIQSLSRVDMASNNVAGLCEGSVDGQLPTSYYRLVN